MTENTLTILDGHALVEHKINQMRHKDCPSELFRARMKEIGMLLAVIATDRLQTITYTVPTPLETITGKRLAHAPVVIPILRAGLVLAEGILSVVTEAHVGHLGLYRDKETLLPGSYMTKLPPLKDRDVIIVDPMLATGGSLNQAIETVLEHGATEDRIQAVTLVASPEGLKAVQERYPQVHVIVAALDRELNDHGYICPGLGDAGDRLFGT
jgi:uracil phosphoribosyltransferase